MKYAVGEISFRFRAVVSTRPGAGLPPSMWSVPPFRSAMLKQKLPPNVWFQGSQSTSTGGRSSRNGHTCAAICWFEQSMRWVLTTPFGVPVEPEVKRIFATVSGPIRANASSTRAVGAGVEQRRDRRRRRADRAEGGREAGRVGAVHETGPQQAR